MVTGFEGHGIYGYNAATKRYVGTWVDDMRTNIYVGEGDWDAGTKTMTYRWSAVMPGGQAMTWIETSQVVSENEQLFRVVFPSPGDGLVMTIVRSVWTACENMRLVRSVRYASALDDRASCTVTRPAFRRECDRDPFPLPLRLGSDAAILFTADPDGTKRGMTASPGT